MEYTGLDELAPVRVPEVHGGGDSDFEGSGRRLSPAHLQKELSKLIDCTKLRALEVLLRSQSNWPQLDRLRELRHPEVSHSWLWNLDPKWGSVLTEADYVANVQKRLGAVLLTGDLVCRLCGAPLDPQLEHAELCPTAEATRGHYTCVRELVDGFRLADSNVSTEPTGLVSTQDRPADILTTAAVPGRSAALDVCITSPNAGAAAGDAAAAAFRRKLQRYRAILPELARAGIVFCPLVWTADARPHPAVTRTLRYAAGLAASRDGAADPRSMLRRWRHQITCAILRRRSAMVRAVLPRRGWRAQWFLTGQGGADAEIAPDDRASQFDEDEPDDANEAVADGGGENDDDDDDVGVLERADGAGENGVDVDMAISGEGAEAVPPAAPARG